MNTTVDQDPEEGTQTLVGHLTELKFRVVRCLWAILFGMIVCYNFTTQMFNYIRAPIAPYLQGGGLIFTAPMDKFMAHLKLAFFGGLVLVFPFVVYQIWKFVSPGLYEKEKKFAFGFVFSGTVMFLLGVLFTYFIVLPMAFGFLMTYGGDIDKPMISIGEYMSFFVTTSIAFGISFEMPVIIVLLGLLGIIKKQFLIKNRRYAIMTIAVLCAVITPPDLLSMLLMLVPMWVLYEISIILVGFFEKKRMESIE